jgi:hypothetical protein
MAQEGEGAFPGGGDFRVVEWKERKNKNVVTED